MKSLIAVLTMGALGCIGTYAADNTAPRADGPIRTVTTEPGVVPSGALLPVRAADSVNTRRAHRAPSTKRMLPRMWLTRTAPF